MSDLKAREFERILLIKPSAVGDVVNALPVLVKLRRRYPHAQIDWLITPQNAPLVASHPDVSNVVMFDRRKYAQIGRSWTTTLDLLGLLKGIRRTRYDLVLDLHGQLRSAVFTLASGAPVRVGYEWTREGAWIAHTHRVPVPTLDVHAVDRYLWLGQLLGFDDAAPDARLYLPPEAEAGAELLMREAGVGTRPFALLVPGTIWETKHWRAEGFAEVGRYFLARGWDVVLAGSPGERDRCRQVAADCCGAIDLCGRTTLAELAVIVRRAGMCVSNDSGSMHIAVALERPVVSAFGPTSAVRNGPYRHPESVVRAEMACAPCYFRKLRQCPHDHACMRDLTADMMIERIQSILAMLGGQVAA
jgi:heptosyltransferase-1